MDLLLNPAAWFLIALLSAGNAIFNLANYELGQHGAQKVMEKVPQITPERWDRVQNGYAHHGSAILLLAAIPGVGTVVTTGAGAAGVPRWQFLLFVFLGKLIRNWLLLLFTDQLVGISSRLS